MREPNPRFELPGAMDEKLRRVQGRLSSVGMVTAVVVGFAVLLGAMLVAMLVDYLATLHDSSWRSALTNSALVAAGAVLVGWAGLAWHRWRRLSSVAREVDRRAPQLEERWAIVTEHAEAANDSTDAPHPAVLRRVAEEANRRGAGVAPRDVASLDGLARAFLAVNAVTVVLVLAAVLDWRQTNVLLRRFWAPRANISATTIAAHPGDVVVGRGEPLTLAASLGGTPVETARLAILQGTKDEQRVTLVPRRSGPEAAGNNTPLTASHRLRRVDESFRYRFRAGDGQTDWSEVTVADRPSIAAARLRVTPPDYREEKPKTYDKMPRRVSIVAGTRVELEVKPRDEITSLRLGMGGEVFLTLSPDADGWYRWSGTPDQTLTLSPILTEQHGLENRRPPVTQVRVYPDRPPVVRVLTPDDEVAVTPNDTVDVSFIAEDDNGVGAAELIVYRHSDDPVEQLMNPDQQAEQVEIERIPIKLDAKEPKRVHGRVALDLSKYQLQDGSSISYEIRVTEQRSPRGEQRRAAAPAPKQPPQAGQGGAPPTEQPKPSSTEIAADAQRVPEQANAKPSGAERPAADAVASDQPSSGNDSPETDAGDPPRPAAPTRGDSKAVAKANANQPAEPTNPDLETADEQPLAKSTPQASPNTDAASDKPTQPNATPPATGLPGIGLPLPKGLPPTGIASNRRANPAKSNAPQKNRPQNTASQKNTAPNLTAQNKKAPNNATNPGDNQPRPTTDPPSPIASNTPQPPKAGGAGQGGTKQPNPQSNNPDGNRSTSSQQRSLIAATPDKKPDQQSGPKPDPTPPEPKAPEPKAPDTNRMAANESNRNRPADNRSSGNQSSGNRSANATQNRQANADGQNRPNDATPPPGDKMARRQSDLNQQAQSGTSNAMRVKIDKYAGSFAGQQRQKLELALAPDIAKFAAHLKRAEKLTRSVLDQLDRGEPWSPRRHRDITTAEGEVRRAQGVASSIRRRTRQTVYAFVGLQVGDISTTNLTPAREHLWQAYQSDAAQRVDSVRSGWRQARRAVDRLERLVRRYDAAQQEHQLADRAQQVKKMYRVFAEDVHTRLGVRPGEGSNHSRKLAEFELDEEYLARLTEVIKMRQELYAELARILDDDPRLLRRFMNNFREQTGSLLKQLEGLRRRQEGLARDTSAWASSRDENRDGVLEVLRQLRLDESRGLADQAGDLAERFEAWLPFEAAADKTDPAAEARAIANNAASHGQELALAAEKGDAALAVAEAESLYQTLREFEVAARRLGGEPGVDGIEDFAVRRVLDSRRLVTRVSSWLRRVREIEQGAFHRAAAIEQYQLASETDRLAAKLGGVEQNLAQMLQAPDDRLPTNIADLARRLLSVLDEQATPSQLGAAIALQQPDWGRVATRQDAAVTAMSEAERLFNEMIAAAIKELDKLPVQDPIASLLDDPTLDEILARLQNERDLAEELGIPQRPSNLQQITDWLNPSGVSGQNGYGRNRGQLLARIRREMQRMNRLSDRMRQDALDRIKKKTANAAKKRAKTKTVNVKRSTGTTDWRKLLSELDSGLLQGRDKLPPQEYRSAIKQYYEIVNRRATEAAEQTPQP